MIAISFCMEYAKEYKMITLTIAINDTSTQKLFYKSSRKHWKISAAL